MKKLSMLIVLLFVTCSVFAGEVSTKLANTNTTIPLSAFGDIRTIELTPQIQGSFEYTVDNTDLNINTIIGSSTVTQSQGMAVLTTGTTTSSLALLQCTSHAKYRPGLGGLARFTALFTDCVAGTSQYAGLLDEAGSSAEFENGYALGCDGGVFSVVRFQGDVKVDSISVFDDPLDGSGKSGINIDVTKLNVFGIRYQYLGAGFIQFLIEDPATGRLTVFHTIDYAGRNIVPSVFNPSFHFSICVDNKATTENIIAKTASYAYFIEGMTNITELQQPQNSTDIQTKTSVTTEVAILTIRNKTTYAGKNNFINILLEHFSASIEASAANNLGSIRLVRNATLGGAPSWSDINATNSVVEIDTSGTTVTGGSTLMTIPLAGKNDKAIINIISLQSIVHEGDTVTIAGTSANSATIKAEILWKELF
jgi:hypothetical protein